MINLVRNESDVAGLAAVNQPPQGGVIQHRAGRVGGRGDQKPCEIRLLCDFSRGWLKPVFRFGDNADRLQIKGFQDVAIAGIAGITDRHARASVKQRDKGQLKRCRGSGGNNNPRGRNLKPVPVLVKPGDPLPQIGAAKGHGIAHRIGLHHLRKLIKRAFGGAGAGLADLHMNDRAPGLFGLPGCFHHVHHNKGIDIASP